MRPETFQKIKNSPNAVMIKNAGNICHNKRLFIPAALSSESSQGVIYSIGSWKRYPTPRTVSIYFPPAPSFLRKPTTCTSTERSVTG